MRAAVANDTTTRTITLEVANAPDIDVTRSYHRKPRIFRPERVTVNLVDGEMSSIEVSGGLVLKSGATSTEVGESQTFYPVGGWSSPQIDKAPQWLQTVAAEAPEGILTWRTGTDAGEVQAL